MFAFFFQLLLAVAGCLAVAFAVIHFCFEMSGLYSLWTPHKVWRTLRDAAILGAKVGGGVFAVLFGWWLVIFAVFGGWL